jgi:hypothetical protein
MYKEEVLAFCVMETVSEPIKPINMKQVKNPMGLFYLTFDSCMQSYNMWNRNNRNYDLDGMKVSMSAAHIAELIKRESWFGEAGHPITEDIKRILTIDPKLISHKISKPEFKGTKLYANIETLCAGYGPDMTAHMLQKMEAAFSLRALAQISKTPEGRQLVKGKSHVVTFDWVVLPSHSDAYQQNKATIVSQTVSESGNILIPSKDKLVSVMESSIVDFIKEESKNLKLVSNVFEVASESMTISKDLKYIILKEGKETYHVKTEDKIKHDILNYMKKI